MTAVTRMVCVPLVTVTVAIVLVSLANGYAQAAAQRGGVESLLQSLPGDWIGTVSQSTNGQIASTKYFHAITRRISEGIYESVFTYYRLDAKGGEPIPVGVTSMATKVATDGTATNRVIGQGDILIDPTTQRPETHDLTEVLHASPEGKVQGTGSGSISVIGMPLSLGKNGKVQEYVSTWLLSNDVLTISQRFKVEFRIFLFRKSYTISADYIAKRGSDVIGLMKGSLNGRPG